MKTRKIKNNSIESIVTKRLTLQTTQNNLYSIFHTYIPNIDFLKMQIKQSNIKNWKNEKMDRLAKILSDKTHVKETKNFISTFID